MLKKYTKPIGVIGTIVCIALFIREPSFPTPDKLFIFCIFLFMAYGQAWQLFKRLFPFVAILLVYESFRGVADKLNTHVDYLLAPHIDTYFFGNLPTIYLQNWLWVGRTSWYDYAFYLPYMLHFILPLGLALLVWKTHENQYWRVIWTYLVVAFAAFLTYLVLPAAPPWLASQNNYIPHIERISSEVWAGLGIHDFPSIYNHITPNQVAAIPSLHAAWATLLFIFVLKIFGRRWAALSLLYPGLIFVGTVYQGEHYLFDVVAGVLYAVVGYWLTPFIMRQASRLIRKISAFIAILRNQLA